MSNNGACSLCYQGVPLSQIILTGFDSATGKIVNIPLSRLLDIINRQVVPDTSPEFLNDQTNFNLTNENAGRFIDLNNSSSGVPSQINLGGGSPSTLVSGDNFNVMIESGNQPITFVNNTGRVVNFRGQVTNPDGSISTQTFTAQPGQAITPLSRTDVSGAQYNLTLISRGNNYDLVGTSVFAPIV